MTKHKLILDDVFQEVSYALIAIHTSLEDYRLAYLLNKSLDINLKRKEKDLDYNYTSASYPLFEWNDTDHQLTWNLVGNTCLRETNAITSTGSLFEDEDKPMVMFHLIPEHKAADYFLMISSESGFKKERVTLASIQKLEQIITAYSVDANTLKSKNNLIFN